MRMMSCVLPLLLATILAGCSSDRAVPVEDARSGQQNARGEDSADTASVPDLGDRIAALSAAERATVHRLLSDPFPKSRVLPDGGDKADVPEHVAAIAAALRRLTLPEADELGTYLDERHQGRAAEFALVPVERQQQALKQIKAIQKRITQPPEDVLQIDVWINKPITTADRDLPWLERRLDRDVKEVVGVSFVREYYDLGPESTDVSDEEMRFVAALAGLRRLDLRLSEVGDDGLKHLRALGHLEHLDLGGTRITDSGLRHLAAMDRLEELRLQGTSIDGTGLAHLTDSDRLQTLHLERVELSDAGIETVSRLKSLQSLSIALRRAHRLNLHDLPRLRTLVATLGGSSGKRATVRLTDLPRLNRLSVSTHDAPLYRLELDGLPKLHHLWITAPALDEKAFKVIGRMTSLRELHLDRFEVPDREFHHLSELSNLTTLAVHRAGLGDAAMPVFENLTALRKLRLGGNGLTDAGLKHLATLRNLEELSVSGVEGTGQGASVIHRMPKLRSLRIGATQLDELRLERHPALENISGNIEQLRRLHVESLPRLERLDLTRAEVIEVGLRDLPKVRWVSLSLVEADKIDSVTLRAMPQLETLRLVPITREGSIEDIPYTANITDAVLEEVGALTNLKRLEVRGAAITDEGLKHLFDLPKLQFASVSGPNVTEEGRSALEEALSRPRGGR